MTAPASWRVAAATVVGSAHAAAGAEGQDAYSVRVRPDGVLVAAVADGAGSAPHGARGAAVAVAAAVGTLCEADLGRAGDDEDGAAHALAAALRAAGAAVVALADADGLALRDVACTLSCAVARADGALAAQVGDGLVVAVGEAREAGRDGALTPLSAPERGGYANETVFLTSPDAVEAAIASIQHLAGPITAIALLTDGLLRLAMNMADRTPHPAFFTPLFRFASRAVDADAAASALATFLSGPRVRARSDDDLTLVLAARPATADPA
ncbi:MAG: PP2C family serine/threonine-protein phosphatase [Anaerolineae bacterium]